MENKFYKNLNSESILQIYKLGIFPMAKSRCDEKIFFINPKKRALLPIKGFHVSRSFSRFIKKIENHFNNLHEIGVAHSIECWKNDEIVGGIYGIAIGRCFFAESMFSSVSNASKFALINLVARLYFLKYSILDIQFINNHLKQFGAFEINQDLFKKKNI